MAIKGVLENGFLSYIEVSEAIAMMGTFSELPFLTDKLWLYIYKRHIGKHG